MLSVLDPGGGLGRGSGDGMVEFEPGERWQDEDLCEREDGESLCVISLSEVSFLLWGYEVSQGLTCASHEIWNCVGMFHDDELVSATQEGLLSLAVAGTYTNTERLARTR